ncbi:unnamed protein product [Mytilus edulis]|uniref:C1q domain-containing protein n=1 Tax=Mytilus edulis TaxID=6550 RepID=A0A8S3T489_MYTED|nr:unnamed protein product [Mytilus edulis]
MSRISFVSFLLYHGALCLHAFLLETSTPAKSVGGPVTNVGNDNHYSALIELLMDEKQHRYQLEQRVAALEQSSGSTQQATRILQLENFVKHLENDLSSVKQSLAQQLNKSNTVDHLAHVISDRSAICTQKYNDLSHRYDVLHTRFNTTNTKLAEVEEKMSNLDQLKGINQLQTIDSLQKEVNSLHSKTDQLFSTSNARSQDFLALYNKTVMSEKKIANMGKTIKTVEVELNQTSSSITANVSEQVQNIERRQNITNLDLKDKISKSSRQVALTTCLSSDIQTSSNAVLKFSDAKTFAGINNLAAFKTTGLFTCEQAGLYLISVTINSHTTGIFSIDHNNAFIIKAYTYNRAGSPETDHISTAVSAVVLNISDTISVRTENALYVHSIYTCMTIIKIK